ncbi:MAG: polymer-forming cytoskeletal protein [Thermomicrobiales bacterium]|nr:polymer-forming cytoskeletal protein [Thermomicrobiales bacterium]
MSYTDQDYGRGGTTALDREDGRSISVIDQYSTFDGSFVAERDLRIDGTVKGTIVCHGTLFVAEGATVNARIEAENITVAGDMTGEVECRGRLRVLPSGVLNGKVQTRALVIAQGAIYNGELTMITAPAIPEVTPEPEPERPRENAPKPRPTTRVTRTVPPSPPRQEPAPSSAEPATPSTFIRRLGGPETPWEDQSGQESAAPSEE